MNRRLNRFIVVSGARGTGKTSLVLKLLSRLSKGRGTLVINPNNEEKFFSAGIREARTKSEIIVPAGAIYQYVPKVAYRGKIRGDRRGRMQKVIEHFLAIKRTGLLVVDDARELTKGNEFTDVFETYLLAGRQNDIDIIFILHSLGQIPPSLVPYITDLIIFASPEASERFFYKLPQSDRVLTEQEKVNTRAKKNLHAFAWVNLY